MHAPYLVNSIKVSFLLGTRDIGRASLIEAIVKSRDRYRVNLVIFCRTAHSYKPTF